MDHRIAAIIVLYYPEETAAIPLIRAISTSVQLVQLFLNSPVTPSLLEKCFAAAGATEVTILGTGQNVGLGRAYNEAVHNASEKGCDLILLLDQDSRVAPGMPARLASSFDRAGGIESDIVIIGPAPSDPATGLAYKAPPSPRRPRDLPSDLKETLFVISSGSLVSVEGCRRIGAFRADFFIDAIDIEWCFRARDLGFRCVMAVSEHMSHRLGRGLLRIPLLRVSFVDQPPVRLFTHARNQMVLMRLAHVPVWWKSRIIVSMILRVLFILTARRPRRELKAILSGVRAGLMGCSNSQFDPSFRGQRLALATMRLTRKPTSGRAKLITTANK